MNLQHRQDLHHIATSIPKHVAIIMDGNGRWAEQRGLPRSEGHAHGQIALKETLKAAAEFGIETLTVYAFSTENWSRPQEEIDALMALLVSAIVEETEALKTEGVRLRAIGDIPRLPLAVQESLNEGIKATAKGDRITLVIALSYSAKDEIRRATQTIAQKVLEEKLPVDSIVEDTIAHHLDTHGLPDLDLLIRTGGEMRISNFLLWQVAYAELYFSSSLWPDFGRNELLKALESYASRERRFGKTSAQILVEN